MAMTLIDLNNIKSTGTEDGDLSSSENHILADYFKYYSASC